MSYMRINLANTAATSGLGGQPSMLGREVMPLFEARRELQLGLQSRGLVAPKPEPQDVAVFSTAPKN